MGVGDCGQKGERADSMSRRLQSVHFVFRKAAGRKMILFDESDHSCDKSPLLCVGDHGACLPTFGRPWLWGVKLPSSISTALLEPSTFLFDSASYGTKHDHQRVDLLQTFSTIPFHLLGSVKFCSQNAVHVLIFKK